MMGVTILFIDGINLKHEIRKRDNIFIKWSIELFFKTKIIIENTHIITNSIHNLGRVCTNILYPFSCADLT